MGTHGHAALADGDVVPSADDALTLAQLGEQVQPGPLSSLVRPSLEMLGEPSGLESVDLTSIDREAGVQTVETARNSGAGFEVPEGAEVAWHDSLCELALEEGRTWNTIRFTAQVEHAMRSPLTVIKGWARRLQTGRDGACGCWTTRSSSRTTDRACPTATTCSSCASRDTPPAMAVRAGVDPGGGARTVQPPWRDGEPT